MTVKLQTGLYGLMVLGLAAGTASAQTVTTQTTTPSATAPVTSTTAKAKDAKTQAVKPDDKSDANASGDATTVTITGQKPVNRIDRQVYDVSKDPDSKTGTAADALNKVPGVSVDPNGVVTMRGKEPQILVNGRPAPYLSGDNRAAALQAMPSGSISSVETIYNPGPQYGSSSSGPILNIITDQKIPPGGFGSLSGQLQSTGSKFLSGFGQYHGGRVTLTGTASLSGNASESTNGSVRRSLDSTGQVLRRSDSNSHSHSEGTSAFTNFSLDYTLNPKDTLTGQLNYNRSSSPSERTGNNVTYALTGAATDISTSSSQSAFAYESQQVGATWSHTGNQAGETLKVDWHVSRNLNTSLSTNLSLYSLATVPANLAGYQTRFVSSTNAIKDVFSVDYNRPIGDDQLTMGAQVTRDTNNSRSLSFGPGPASATTLAPSTFGNNQFDYLQTVSAAYASYQKPFGQHWMVLAGVRAERFELDFDAITTNQTNHVEYTTWNPSLFATYVFSEKAKLRFNYSHKLLLPNPGDYNPSTVQTSETSVSEGRANLKPQMNDAVEAGYEYNVGRTSYQVRGYYNHDSDMVIYASTFIPDPLNLGNLVLRTGRFNAGTRDATGLEFNYKGRPTPKLSLTLGINLSNTTFDSPNFSHPRSVAGITGNQRLSYQATKTDSFTLSYNIAPRLLNAQGQGYRSGYGTMNLSYYHSLPQKLSLSIGINNLLRSNKIYDYTLTPTVNSFSVRSNQAPVFTISLSRSLTLGSGMPKGSGPIVIGGGGSTVTITR